MLGPTHPEGQMNFKGTVKPRRRGGWIARGLIVEERHGQVFETQVGPREFAEKKAGSSWLEEVAKQLGYGKPTIAVLG
jgi:hypothetical protein